MWEAAAQLLWCSHVLRQMCGRQSGMSRWPQAYASWAYRSWSLSEPPLGSRMVVPACSVFRGGSRGTASVKIRIARGKARFCQLAGPASQCYWVVFLHAVKGCYPVSGALSRCAPAAVNLVLSFGIASLIALDPLPQVTVWVSGIPRTTDNEPTACFTACCVLSFTRLVCVLLVSPCRWRLVFQRVASARLANLTWLILPVVICLSQRLSHACLSISFLLRNCEWLIITVIIY